MNCTQLLAYTLLAACAAAAGVIVPIDDGNNCGSFCSEANAAISMGMLAFALLAFSAAISSQRLRA